MPTKEETTAVEIEGAPAKSKYAYLNIYQKLQLAKVRIQKSVLGKSGENGFSHYSYLNLVDFMPLTNEVFNELGLYSKFNMDHLIRDDGVTDETATLVIINMDDTNTNSLIFKQQTADAKVAGASPTQNAGAKATYFRRYLYIQALDLAISDKLDDNSGGKNKQGEYIEGNVVPDDGKRMISKTQTDKLSKLCLDEPEIAEKMLKAYQVNSISEMTETIASSAIKRMIASIKKERESTDGKQ